MNNLFKIILVALYFGLQRCLSFFLLPLIPFFSFTRRRFAFEWKYRNQQAPNEILELCVHVSSQGELEQARPFIDEILESGNGVQIIFTSPSVEKDLLELRDKFPEKVFIHALPILLACFSFPHYKTYSEKFMMVRYDFFPELLLRAIKLDSTLLFATFKGKNNLNWFKLFPYTCFKRVVAAREKDREILIENKLPVVSVSDFRVLRVEKRLLNEEVVLKRRSMSQIGQLIKEHFKKNSIIFGSSWEVDLDYLNTDLINDVNSGKFFLCLCPHKINNNEVDLQRKRLESLGLRVCSLYKDAGELEVAKAYSEIKNGGVVLISAIPGMLCEFYKSFHTAYVAGGFGRSIHSVLEPYLAEAFVICGPKTHRSTEFDLILDNDPSSIKSINTSNELYESLVDFSKRDFKKDLVHSKINEIKNDYLKIKESIL